MRAGSWGSNLLMCLYGALVMAAVGKVIPLIGPLSQDLGITPTDASWLISGVTVVGILVAPFAGRLSRWASDRRIIAISLAVGAAGSAVVAVSPNFAGVMTGRIIEGIALFFVVNSALTLLMKTNSGSRRSGASGLFLASIPLGLGVSAALVGQLTEVGWRAIFGGHAALMAVAVLGCALLPAATGDAAAAPAGGSILSAYRRPGPLWLGLAAGATSMIQFGIITFYPTYLTATYQLPLKTAVTISSAGALVGIAGALLASLLLGRGVRGSLISVLVLAVMVPAGALAFLSAASFPVAVAGYLVFLLLGGGVNSALVSLVPMVAEDPARIGDANAVLTQIASLGNLMAPPLLFSIYGAAGSLGPRGVTLALVALPLAILFASGLVKADRVRRPDEILPKPA